MSEDNGSHLSVLAQTQPENPQEQTHQAPNSLTYDEAKLYLFAMSEEWRPLTIADVNEMHWEVVDPRDNPYNILWIEDDVVQIALSVSSPDIKRFLRLVRK